MTDGFAISKILLPVEFSDRCRGAARYAEAMASRFRSSIVLLHVLAPPYAVYGGAGEVSSYCSISDVLAERVSNGQAQLDSFQREMTPDLPVSSELVEGDPARVIVEYAHAQKFDLVVMPTHGYGPFRRFLIGSVTAKVLHDVDTPVWTGPHLEDAPDWKKVAWRRIACAVDLGPHSRSVVQWAAGMASGCGARLTVVHAIAGSSAAVGGLSFDPDWRIDVAHHARERIEHCLAENGIGAEIHIEIGDAPAAVPHAVQCVDADLLVIGRGASSGVFGRLRANAYAIIRESPCPVVSV